MRTNVVRPSRTPDASKLPWQVFGAMLVAAVSATLLCLSLAGPASAADDDDDDGGEYVPRQVVVALAPGVSVGGINSKFGTTTLQRLPGENIYLLQTPPRADPVTLAGRMRTDTRVLYAEPNFRAGSPEASKFHRAHPGGTPTPSTDATTYRSQYAVGNLRLTQAHAVNRGAGSVVAVIDTGVQVNHPQLSSRLTGARYDLVDGGEPHDVGNGRDDDLDGLTDETVGHGTHVAGVVALAAPEARIMPVRALDSDGRGTTFGIAKAMQFAVNNGADVVNLSLGSSHESDLLEDLMDEDDSSGAVFVAAAGNDGDSLEQFPAAEDDAIAVASVTAGKTKSPFSNFGNVGNPWVDVAAPGTDVHSPFPVSRYAKWSGTSMATPFVAGQAALVLGARPSADSDCVSGIIQTTAESLAATDPTFASGLGSGHANAAASTSYAKNQTTCPVPAGDD